MIRDKRVTRKPLHMLKEFNNQDYITMPGQEWRGMHKDLTLAERAVFQHMYSFPEGIIYDVGKVARQLYISERTVSEARRALQRKGYLFVLHEKTADTYILGKRRIARYKNDMGFNDEAN